MKRLLLAGMCMIVPGLAQAETKVWSYGPIPVYQFNDNAGNFCGMLLINNDRMFAIYEYPDRHIGIAIYGHGNTIRWTSGGTVAASIDGSAYSLDAKPQDNNHTLFADLGSYNVNGSLRNFLHDLSTGRTLTVAAGSAYQASFLLTGFAATAVTLMHKCGDVIAGQPQQTARAPATPQPTVNHPVEVALNRSNGVNTVFGAINGMPVNFILDSGSGDVSISPSFAKKLAAQGSLSDDDYLGLATYVYADGKPHRRPQYRLRSVAIGGYTVTDVTCSINADDQADFLLGQTFLGRLSSWSIDNARHVLIIR